jgi:hypothetical protein
MNELIYICRSVANSENAICRLNKAVNKMAKCVRKTNAGVIYIGLVSIAILSVVAAQDKEIKVLQKKVADLEAKTETHDTTEEQTEQEGA